MIMICVLGDVKIHQQYTRMENVYPTTIQFKNIRLRN